MVHWTAPDALVSALLAFLGEHHVMNALAAIAAAGELGVSLPDAVARLETVEIAERWRMQPLGSERVRIINDAYNANPDSMSAALRTLAQITEPGQRKVAVLGAMSELGEFAGENTTHVCRCGCASSGSSWSARRAGSISPPSAKDRRRSGVLQAADEAYEYLSWAGRQRPR